MSDAKKNPSIKELRALIKENKHINMILSEQHFYFVTSLPSVIIYFWMEWSGQERSSRAIFLKIINDINLKDTTVYIIDCSDTARKFATDWLRKQERDSKSLIHQGLGETIFVKSGEIVDFIRYPGGLGFAESNKKIQDWVA